MLLIALPVNVMFVLYQPGLFLDCVYFDRVKLIALFYSAWPAVEELVCCSLVKSVDHKGLELQGRPMCLIFNQISSG